ncbi:MAG: hypothetical protein IKN04_12010 [Clostridia bacterium]|nr:hypothetical protein [Clostridia bacterium]
MILFLSFGCPPLIPCGSGGTRHGFARALIFLFRCPPLFHAEAAGRATASPVRSSFFFDARRLFHAEAAGRATAAPVRSSAFCAFTQTCIVVLTAPKCKGKSRKMLKKVYRYSVGQKAVSGRFSVFLRLKTFEIPTLFPDNELDWAGLLAFPFSTKNRPLCIPSAARLTLAHPAGVFDHLAKHKNTRVSGSR